VGWLVWFGPITALQFVFACVSILGFLVVVYLGEVGVGGVVVWVFGSGVCWLAVVGLVVIW
ncbi:hypothetical protein U1Q18_028727, partial [Sarracenia purpurea var. burkii]